MVNLIGVMVGRRGTNQYGYLNHLQEDTAEQKMLWDVALSHLLVRIDQVALAVKLGVRARDDDAMSVNVKMISVPLRRSLKNQRAPL